MKTAQEIMENLPYFTGTVHYYKHPLGIMLTDGVKYLAESAEMWWYADLIASYQYEPKVRCEEFQVYKLKVNEDKSAIVEITDGNKNILMVQKIEYTDCPLKEVVLWFENGVCYLPSEH
jgi:hypothetical protein